MTTKSCSPMQELFARAQVSTRRDKEPASEHPYRFNEQVARRLASSYPTLSAAQRRALAEVVRQHLIHKGKTSLKFCGLDARGRPVLNQIRYGTKEVWSILRSGEPGGVA